MRLLDLFRQQDPRHRIAAYRAVICALLLGRETLLNPDCLPEDSVPGLYARAAIAAHGGDKKSAKAFLEKARAAGSRSAPRFESDLRLLGFEE